MQKASLSPDHYRDVLARLPPGLDLDALAWETKAIERHRGIDKAASLLRLALARGPGGLSLSQTATWAGLIGFADLTGPGVKHRIDKAADFLDALLSKQLAACGQAASLHWPGRVLRAADGTVISQLGSKGFDWRVHAVFDLGLGRFSHLTLTDCHGAESMSHGATLDGEIRIGDRNYARAGTLQDLREQSGGKADFIVRMSWRTWTLSYPDGRRFDVIDHLATLPEDYTPHEVFVKAQTGRKKPPLPLRLVIVRKPPEAAESTRKKLSSQAKVKQRTLDPRTLTAAGFMILATSLPVIGYPAEEILAAYRLRWQIELAFKRLKSLFHIDQIPTRTEAASRSWLLAHLVLAVLCDDMTQDYLESFPSGDSRRGISALHMESA